MSLLYIDMSLCTSLCTSILTSHGHIKCVQSLHRSIRIYIGVIILGDNTLYVIFCLLKEMPMGSKGFFVFRSVHSVQEGWRRQPWTMRASVPSWQRNRQSEERRRKRSRRKKTSMVRNTYRVKLLNKEHPGEHDIV